MRRCPWWCGSCARAAQPSTRSLADERQHDRDRISTRGNDEERDRRVQAGRDEAVGRGDDQQDARRAGSRNPAAPNIAPPVSAVLDLEPDLGLGQFDLARGPVRTGRDSPWRTTRRATRRSAWLLRGVVSVIVATLRESRPVSGRCAGQSAPRSVADSRRGCPSSSSSRFSSTVEPLIVAMPQPQPQPSGAAPRPSRRQDAGGHAVVARRPGTERHVAHQQGHGEPDAGQHARRRRHRPTRDRDSTVPRSAG